MSKKRRRDIKKDRYDKSYDSKGGEGKGFLDFRSLDQEVDFFKPERGRIYKIIIIPYTVKTKNHPGIGNYAEIGGSDYLLDITIHRNVGAEDQDVICLKSYNKPCPICDYTDELKEAGKEKEYKAIKSTRRAIYNIIDIRDEKYSLKVFTVSHYLFEKELVETAMGYDADGQMVPFASVEDGKVIQFKAVKGKDWTEFKAFQFKSRPEDLDGDKIDKLIDETISFDELIKVYSYEELKAILYEQSEEEEEDEENEDYEEETSNRNRKRRKRGRETKAEKKIGCPYDLKFGKDLDSEDDCEDCKENNSRNYKACEEKFEEDNE